MKKHKDIIIIGFALFSVFFGAGNLIFPPFIGLSSGTQWLTSFLGFILADVGIILLGITAIGKIGSFQDIIGKAGKSFGIGLELIMMLCLGPILVIPRTAATTFEMSITPILGSSNKLLFSCIFFGIACLLTIKPTKVLDIIGKFLTPILLVALGILIVKGIISPIGTIAEGSDSAGSFVHGLTQGYQTMDALGIGGVTAFVMASFITKGYKDKKEISKLTLRAALLAGAGLALVYGGLTYLGATVSNVYATDISQTELFTNIVNSILLNTGSILMSIVVGVACLTTAIGLTSVTANYFETLSNKRLKYQHIVIFICVFSTVMSILGVDKIISIAAPILTVIYPVSIVLIIMSYFRKFITRNSVYVGAAYATLFISLLTVIDSLGFAIDFIHALPLASYGFNWIVPAILGAIIGFFFKSKENLEGALN